MEDIDKTVESYLTSFSKILFRCTKSSLNSALNESLHSVSSEFANRLFHSFGYVFSEAMQNVLFSIPSMLENSSSLESVFKHITEVIESLPDDFCGDNDYVEIDKPAIKELSFTDSFAIPFGNKRIRIKSSDFIALLSLIFSIIFQLSGCVSDDPQIQINEYHFHESPSYEIKPMFIFLDSVFSSLDASNSSQSDTVFQFQDFYEHMNVSKSNESNFIHTSPEDHQCDK